MHGKRNNADDDEDEHDEDEEDEDENHFEIRREHEFEIGDEILTNYGIQVIILFL